MTALKHVLRGTVLLALLVFGAVGAKAAPVQEFGVQLKDITPTGRFTVVFTSNSFDTTGGPPPPLTEASVRFAKGISIKPQFLRRDRLCDTGKLRGVLLDEQTSGLTYGEMLRDLPAAEARIGKRLTANGRTILDTCRKAFFGSGNVVVDARPQYSDPVPGVVYLFLAKPTAKGAVAGVGAMSLYDQSSPIASNDALVTHLQPVFTVNIFNEPTPDGLYGYRVKLLPENVRSLRLSVAELRIQSKGIVETSERRTCVKRRRARCVQYTVRKTTDFWAQLPKCPRSGQLPFKASYGYATGPGTTSVIQVPCPRFTR